MANKAINDPNYKNVENGQKNVMVRLFDNPIPADGPREEGPEWAREVDSVVLVGSMTPRGIKAGYFLNGRYREFGDGGADPVYFNNVNVLLKNGRESGAITLYGVRTDHTLVTYVPTITYSITTGNTILIELANQDGYIGLHVTSTNGIHSATYNNDNIDYEQFASKVGSVTQWYVRIKLPDYYDQTIPIILT